MYVNSTLHRDSRWKAFFHYPLLLLLFKYMIMWNKFSIIELTFNFVKGVAFTEIIF